MARIIKAVYAKFLCVNTASAYHKFGAPLTNAEWETFTDILGW